MKEDSKLKLLAYKALRIIPDKWFLSLKFRKNMGYWMDWGNPKTFNEKLQWLKINNRRPEYTLMVDKFEAKKYVADIIGSEYIIPTLGVWSNPEDIDFDSLPDQFVMKATHDSGRVVICRDKSTFDRQKAVDEMRKSLHRDFYAVTREWPYKNVPRRVIAEMYMDNNGKDLEDYKVHCFNGKPEIILVCRDRFGANGLTEDFYDTEWNHLDIRRPSYPNAEKVCDKPDELDEIIELAKSLSKNIPFSRIDFYIIQGKVYFGEITLYPASGTVPFIPNSVDYDWGVKINLIDFK